MTSVSAHGGLVHVIMMVRSLTAEGITSLVMNSPKLIKLCFNLNRSVVFNVMNCNTELRKKFRHRKLLSADLYSLSSDIIEDVLCDTDLRPLWYQTYVHLH